MAFPGEVLERRKKEAFPGIPLETGGAFPGEAIEQRQSPKEDILSPEFIEGASATVEGLKEAPGSALRGVIRGLEGLVNIPIDVANAVTATTNDPATHAFLAQNPAIPAGERARLSLPSEFSPVPGLDVPKPAAPETDFGKFAELSGELASGLIPLGGALKVPSKAFRALRGVAKREAVNVARTEVLKTSQVAVESAIAKDAVKEAAPAIQASEAATKAADALTPDAVLAERALPKKVEGFSSKRYTPPEAAALEAGKGFRETRTFAEIKAAADASGMSVEDLVKTKRGAVWSSEEAFTDALTRARVLRRNESTRFRAIADKLDFSNPEHLKIYENEAVKFTSVSEKAVALESESGRALGSLRMNVSAERQLEKAVRNITSGKFGVDPAEQLKMLQTLDDPVQVARFMRLLPEATTSDKFMEAWINGLLSGITTQVKNTVSNGLVAAYSLPERALAATFGIASKGERVYFREVTAQASGMAKAMKKATTTAYKTFRDEGVIVGTGKVELRTRQAIGKGSPLYRSTLGRVPGLKNPGKLVRIPGRALEAMDQWFKAINYGGEIEALATRQAIKEGMKAENIGKRVAEILANPSDDLAKMAWKKAEVATFTNSLQQQEGLIASGARAISKLADNHASARIIFPFVRTPTNIFKFSVARSPFGFALKDVRNQLALGGVARQQALANITLGSAVSSTAALYALDGRITGAGPSDSQERKIWRLSGRQPYSIKIGDKWYAYGGLEPLGTLVGIAADFAEIGNKISAGERDKIASMAAIAFSRNVKEKTFLQGMSQLIEALDDPDRFGERFVQNLVGSAVPSVVAQAARANDPVIRDVQGMIDRIKSRIPLASESVPPLLNLWGEEIKREGSTAELMFSPVYVSTQKNDPVTEEMVRLGVSPRMPEREMAGIRLTPEQYTTFVREAGRPAKAELDSWVRDPEWKEMTDPERFTLMKRIVDETRAQARKNLIMDNEALLDAKDLKRMGER